MHSLSHRSRLVLGLLSLAQLMVILDISAVNVALPELSRSLDIAPADIQWTITSYSLLFGSLLVLGGRAADRLGRRRMFLAGLGAFTAASLVAALAPSAGVLYAARAAQGIGAAMLSPAALSIITTTFTDRRDRAVALGVWGAVGGGGAAIGVLMGGVLTEWIDWRAIFFVNLPVAALVGGALPRLVPADAESPRWRGLDLRGALLATASLASILYALSDASDIGWSAARTLILGAVGTAGLAAFVALERRTAQPLLRLERLAERGRAVGLALMLPASAILFGSFLLTSVYLQEVLGSSPLETGLEFLPIAAAAGLGAHLGGRLIRQAGVRVAMAAAFALAGAGMLLLSQVDASGSYLGDVLPGMLVTGVGLGVAMVSVAIAVLTGAQEDDAGMLSGLNSTGHEVGGAFGVAALTTIATGGLGASSGVGALAGGLSDAFLVAAGIAGAGLVLALALLPSAGGFLPQLRDSAEPVSIH
jgi:EmrB/QacA subfamily drug resistance transporter